ncbi:MAG TPA: DNA polymerase III subunit gamma and tau [Actinophytocola sp.]|uniref:DNA polymerase III subunit gamma and tau n=1 Tax=Actinophytocola sp. TaxID=1872138 RepID=UPI002DB5D5B9|nr:DNA polymerase III subunit gamma and tau [Actinophytocola sp.]HEU5470865.1 DNA polymerase III subunit gamma and tau [Actinophytocola sp.]
MALALYRKYRPATFAEVVGQEHVTGPLRTALAAGRINHAYLFSGPRGCGKTSSARILARSLNCAQGPTPDPCGICDSCVGLAPEGPGSVDVIELDAASHGGVDDARELRDRAFYAPAASRFRVFIIDEAHMVTPQGFNALLKIVEEPPEHLVFIFATTEPDKVLPTIRSRTHHYPFRLIPPSAMRELLERNCADEGATVEPAVFPLVIRAGGGSARDTQSVLDQLLAGAGAQGVTYDRAVALLGVSDVALIDDLVDGLAADDSAAVFGTVDRLVEAGHDPRRFAADLLDRLRDLVLLRAVPDAASRGLVNAPGDELDRMSAQAQRLGPAALTRFAEIVHNGLVEMRGATAPRLLLELLCARMLLPAAVSGDAAADSAVLQRIERMERRVSVGSEPVPAQPQPKPQPQASTPAPAPARQPEPPQPPVQPRPEPAATPPSPVPPAAPAQPGALDAAGIRRVWSELLAVVRKNSRSTEAMLTNATVHAVEGETVVISHTAAPLARRLADPRNVDAIAEALRQVLGGNWQVKTVHANDSGEAPSRPAAPPPAPVRPEPSRPEPVRTRPAAAVDPAAPEPPPEPDDYPDDFQEPDPDPGPRNESAAAVRLLKEQLGARKLD